MLKILGNENMIDEKQIQDWLVEEGIFRQKIPDDNSNFHFLINYPNNNALDVICPKGKDDQIIIGCATEVSQQEQVLIHNTKKAVNQEFIWNIRFALNSFMLDFELEHPNDELKRFIITDFIFEDGLTKDRLISTIKKIFKGKLHCIWLLGKTYGQVNPNSEAPASRDSR